MGRTKAVPTKTPDTGNSEAQGRAFVGKDRLEALFASNFPWDGETRDELSAEEVPRKPSAKKRKSKTKQASGMVGRSHRSAIELPRRVHVERNDDQLPVRILFHPTDAQDTSQAIHKDDSKPQVMDLYRLSSFALPCPVQTLTGDALKTMTTITSALDVHEMLSLSHPHLSIEQSTILNACVEHGHLHLALDATHAHWSITRKCLDACQPAALPVGSRRKALLPQALSVFYEELQPQSTTPSAVTARQFYAWVDNQQLLQRRQDEGCVDEIETTSRIPGLVPKLREYQRHAVQWMLQREKSTMDHGDEWKVLWVVLGDTVEPLVSHQSPSCNTRLLLYSPYCRWLATSVEEALAMSLPVGVRGGILAESMGLGKTVEVLACILGHPRPTPTTMAQPVKRRLDFASDSAEASVDGARPFASRNADSDGTHQRVGVNEDDWNDFVDTEDSSSDEEMREARFAWTTTSSAAGARLVTPETAPKETEVRWLDSSEETIGSCICGNIIGLGSTKEAFVVCPTCTEPMHAPCAAIANDQDLVDESKPLLYRQIHTHKEVRCRLLRSDARCPCCKVTKGDKPESRATLIVTPPAILDQWLREIENHTKTSDGKPLNVAIYDGVSSTVKSYGPRKQNVHKRMRLLHPDMLADHDIVLITFDTLMSDLNHSDDNGFVGGADALSSPKSLRARKKYRVVPSPLTSIRWWRVCLDEAQRVETPTAGSARMALKLETSHRWCVSGTPIGRGKLEDLYGLLLFLRMSPFNNHKIFQQCFNPVHKGYEDRIQHGLADIFWRSTKDLDVVREQMGIPEQQEIRTLLSFSSVEKHFYERQLQQTVLLANDTMKGRRSTKKMNVLAENLHQLRAACCHPQVGVSGLGKSRNRRGQDSKASEAQVEAGVAARVMSMEDILDKLVDEAKLKCEEAQRLAIMHANAVAALHLCRVEARARGVDTEEGDDEILGRSLSKYLESLRQTDENAEPTPLLSSASVAGSEGFLTPGETMRSIFALSWKLSGRLSDHISAEIDFGSVQKRIKRLRVRQLRAVPSNLRSDASDRFVWKIPEIDSLSLCAWNVSLDFFEEVCRLDVSSTVADHVFHVLDGFGTKRAKKWQLLAHIKDDEDDNILAELDSTNGAAFVGFEVEFNEPLIAQDELQRLHCLHNASECLETLVKICEQADDLRHIRLGHESTTVENAIKELALMRAEATAIEERYMNDAHRNHAGAMRAFERVTETRKDCEERMLSASAKAGRSMAALREADPWSDEWFDDFLSACLVVLSNEDQSTIFERIVQELDSDMRNQYGEAQGGGGARHQETRRKNEALFPRFNSLRELQLQLKMRIERMRTGMDGFREDLSALETVKCSPKAHATCMSAVSELNTSPSKDAILENRQCHICKADFNQTGPKCSHCRLEDELGQVLPDRITVKCLIILHNVVKSQVGQKVIGAAKKLYIPDRARLFFEYLDAASREKKAASRLWRVHLDLLNLLDELAVSKSRIRLTLEGENLSRYTEAEMSGIVQPLAITQRTREHEAREAMAHGDLRRARGSLNYLKHMMHDASSDECVVCAKACGAGESIELDCHHPIHKECHGHLTKNGASVICPKCNDKQCPVCLEDFEAERAVLRCGHRVCPQCVTRLSRGIQVRCPYHCKILTRTGEVLIGSSKRSDDGSQATRAVKGSFGTKIARLVSDLLMVRDKGDKALVFSQWEDMLDIVQHALSLNDVVTARARTRKEIGHATKVFRGQNCTALLLNVKHGAEGLTLVDATHVFMIEPLLNPGLDSQAINRIHRIGQMRKTYIHRYLIRETIEEKIDRIRIEHQAQGVEDSPAESRRSSCKASCNAGGIDGTFDDPNDLIDLLNSD